MTSTETPKSLVTKLADVMAAVERIPKRGRNDFHKYDYATEADIVATVRTELASRHVMLVPEVNELTSVDLGANKKGEPRDPLTVLRMTFTFLDGDSGESIPKHWVGVGQDGGDKGAYKAMTGAEKYFLLKTFLIPTGDDPEREEKETQKAREKATVKPTATERKGRAQTAAAAAGAVYIDKFTPRSKGNSEWAEIVTSGGEELIVSVPPLISLCLTIAQENVPAILTAHVNAKGRTQLDAIARWQPDAAPSATGDTAQDVEMVL